MNLTDQTFMLVAQFFEILRYNVIKFYYTTLLSLLQSSRKTGRNGNVC